MEIQEIFKKSEAKVWECRNCGHIIVDQIFIANANYLGSYGNAANTVVFPLTAVALSIAMMIGDGCCAFVSISLGAGNKDTAHKSIGSAVLLCVLSGLILTALYLIFQEPILTLFGVGFALLLPLRFGPDGVLYSMPVSDVLTFVICVIVIRYTYKALECGKKGLENFLSNRAESIKTDCHPGKTLL